MTDIPGALLDDAAVFAAIKDNLYFGGERQILEIVQTVRKQSFEKGYAEAHLPLRDRFNTAEGAIENVTGIKTVGALRESLAELPDDMAVFDGQGHPLEIDIRYPNHLKPYVEVQ